MRHIRESFDKKAVDYDEWILSVCPFYTGTIAELLKHCPRNARFVLDLGGGSGIITRHLLELYPKAQVTLVDISPKMLACAREKLSKYGDRVVFFEKDIADFSSPYTFDLVVTSLAMHHIEPRKKDYFCANVFKMLNPNGYFFILEQSVGATRHFQEKAHAAWIEYMQLKGLEKQAIDEVLQRKEDHDYCETVFRQLERLKKCGFFGVDVLYKRDGIVLLGAQKY
jgi:tRNA (cmo5U34)-methyltransferase